MPAMLTVGDFERIAAKYKPDWQDYTEYLVGNFMYGTGAIVGFEIAPGQVVGMNVPTITPAQRSDGRCVFLDNSGHCSIHDVSPYGCSRFDSHQSAQEGDERSRAALREIMDDIEQGGSYLLMLETLEQAGRQAPDTFQRRAEFQRQHALAESGQ